MAILTFLDPITPICDLRHTIILRLDTQDYLEVEFILLKSMFVSIVQDENYIFNIFSIAEMRKQII